MMPALLPLILGSLCPPPPPVSSGVEPNRDRLIEIVYQLASPEFEGRRGAGGRAAGDYLIGQLQRLGLDPAFGDRFDQEFTAGDRSGRNIAAMLPGADPERTDEWIILSAHYDHLGIRGGRLFPGADDNASGVAMVLEVARCLVDRDERPGRGILFVFFDLEEEALLGSRYFVQHPPVPLDQIRLFVTADMLGRSLAGIAGDALFVMGTEHAPGLRPWVVEAAEGLPLTVGVVGADLLVIDRSDYGPFRQRKVPFLFFSTGESPVYHTPDDVPQTIDFEKLASATTLIGRVVLRSASADTMPAWTSERSPWIGEAVAIRGVFELLLEHQEELGIPGAQRALIRGMLNRISRSIEEGTITPEDRTAMLRVSQLVLFTVL
ncbi:M28 family metallopeptidase [Tautonia sociabilis]|nr:M28 family peptidase [Tautonia sociabilis]